MSTRPSQYQWNKLKTSCKKISALLITGVNFSLCAFFLLGCSSHSSGFLFVQQDITVTVHIAPNANNSNAIAVDILMPLTDETEAAVTSLTARQWFSEKAQFERDYTPGQDFWVLHYEYVPGTKVPPISISLKDQTKSIIVFADYQTKGVHRFRTTRGDNLILTLGESDFSVVDSNFNSSGS